MKKNIKKLASFVFSLAMMASMLYALHPCAVQAAESSEPGPTCTFSVKYSCGYDGKDYKAPFAEVLPDLSVDFDLAAGEAVAASRDDQLPLKEGIMNGIEKTHYNVSFRSSDYSASDLEKLRTQQSQKKWADISSHVNTSDSDQTKKLSIDFSKVKFPSPGIYHYVLSATPTSPENITSRKKNDSAKKGAIIGETNEKFHIFVYVMQNDDNSLSVNAFNAYFGEPPLKDNSNGNVSKTGGISFSYAGTGFSVDKGVAGNMGDKNEYFTFNVSLKNLDKNMIYRINTKAEKGTDPNPNDEYFISDSSGTANVKIKLKNGDEAIFPYLPVGATYTIREEQKDGYDALIGTGGKNAVDAIYTSVKDHPSGLEHHPSDLEYNEVYGYCDPSWSNVKKIKLSQKEKPIQIYGTDDSGKEYTKTVTEIHNKYIFGSYNENNEVGGAITNLYTTSNSLGIDHTLHYINVRNGVLPTGIVLNNLPAIFGILSIALMAVIIFLTRKKPAKKQ